MRVFLTGGSGFLGGRVAQALVNREHTVVATVRPGSRRKHLDALGIEVVEGQLDDRVFLSEAMRGCDGLAHIAGAAGRFYPDPSHYHAVNVDLTQVVFEEARRAGIRRAVMCGTVVIEQGLRSPYADSKREAVALAHAIGGDAMTVATVHPSGMVGPGDCVPTPLGRGLVQFAEEKVPVIMSGGGGFVHVDDSAEMHVAALERGEAGGSYASNTLHMSLQELFTSLASALNVRCPRVVVPGWLLRAVVGVMEPVCRWMGRVPPMTSFTVSYLQQNPSTTPDGTAAREALGLPAPRSVIEGCLQSIAWQRAQRP